MSMTKPDRLTDFGKERVEAIAEQRSREMQSHVSNWRYYGTLGIELVQLATLVSILYVLFHVLTADPDNSLIALLGYFGLLIVLGLLKLRVRNPDPDQLRSQVST